MNKISLTVVDEVLIDKIYLIRNQKVMMDKDLALLYGVKTLILIPLSNPEGIQFD